MTVKARVHVNQHNIKWNAKNVGDERPVITVKTYKSNEYADSVEINGPSKAVSYTHLTLPTNREV